MSEEDLDPNAREIRNAMSYKERLLLNAELTPEESEEIEMLWTEWTQGDKDPEEIFFAAYHLGKGNGAAIIFRAAQKTIADVKKKQSSQ
jgi:hypothetical protein